MTRAAILESQVSAALEQARSETGGSPSLVDFADVLFDLAEVEMRAVELRVSRVRLFDALAEAPLAEAGYRRAAAGIDVDAFLASVATTRARLGATDLVDAFVALAGPGVFFDVTEVEQWVEATVRCATPASGLAAAYALTAIVHPDRARSPTASELAASRPLEPRHMVANAIREANVEHSDDLSLLAVARRLLRATAWRRELALSGFPVPEAPSPRAPRAPVATAFAHVVFHDDDRTTMDFVVHVLTAVLSLPRPEAVRAMRLIHTRGSHRFGPYPTAQAHAYLGHIVALARASGHPLELDLEPVE